MMDHIWLTIVLPLTGVVTNGLFGRRLPRNLIALIGCATVGGAFLLGLLALGEMLKQPADARVFEVKLFTWIPVAEPDFRLRQSGFDAALLLDPLSIVMLLVVTGIGFLIHVYSIGYMWNDPGFSRYFTYLNLFQASMLTLVLANNFLMLYVGWELVGLCSYLLIGFWLHKPSAADAGKKAFIVNRVGDFGFALGTFAIFRLFGSLDYSRVFSEVRHSFVAGDPALTVVALLLFLGAVGKSAQVPLHVWLPDAMEGPTPVSALIHAATMVTAGVYMVVRCHVIFAMCPVAMTVVAVIGAATAVFAASIALVQNDIKRVLAYSTISQLGYMFLGCGAGAFAAAIFHLMTHAFFKALLFLASGSVIHALEHALHHSHEQADPQDMRNMGGLRKRMKITAVTFIIGAAALAGIPGFSGFFSKEEILIGAWGANRTWWALGIIGAMMTAFYMIRQVMQTFFGRFHLSAATEAHLRESPSVMLLPLLLLAVGAIAAGWIAKPFADFLSPVLRAAAVPHAATAATTAGGHGTDHVVPMVIAIGAAAIGVAVGVVFYGTPSGLPARFAARIPSLYRLLLNKYYVDEIYACLFVRPGHALARFLAQMMDAKLVDGFVNGLAGSIGAIGERVRGWQTSYVRNYALSMVAGIVILVLYLMAR